MGLRRTRDEQADEVDVVIDLRERLAVYEDAKPRPGWRDDLIAEDAKRARRPLIRPRHSRRVAP
jgi:hypothetical protein